MYLHRLKQHQSMSAVGRINFQKLKSRIAFDLQRIGGLWCVGLDAK
jgi:hypothetical protein